ncbi:MAG: hypothetical protein HOW73_39235 [Polyangiaceae bacterium]|nr:hypothetical protein [Polyangiaceae bacterium]
MNYAVPDHGSIILERPEGLSVRYGGWLLSVWGGPVHDELLAATTRGVEVAAAEHGGPIAIMTRHRADPRFPLGVDFASNLPNIRRAMVRIRPAIRASATIVDFDGFIAKTMDLAVSALSRLALPGIPMRVCSSSVDAAKWLLEVTEPTAPSVNLRALVRAATEVEALYQERRSGWAAGASAKPI